jgi:hypothetical protein
MQITKQDLLFRQGLRFCHGQLIAGIALALLLRSDESGGAGDAGHLADTLRFTQIPGDDQVSPGSGKYRQHNENEQKDAA